MTVIDITKDYDTFTLTATAEFAADLEDVWQLWADPRKLEKWWGPPTYPATFDEHDLTPGGAAAYYMTSPEGEKYRGWWRITDVDAPHGFEFNDGFADESGTPIDDMPVCECAVRLSSFEGGTRLLMTSVYANRAEMEKAVEMGMVEGLTAAMGQMDALLP
ncbi:uncharacterized protein YndB with AHSA1/START domain [Marmoricola sp. OAE513]|uniref:SRPBCC family protein n=1 Tax=Marmoricola sp. OAE513 TaxID=2817894 RepID=UPI001AE2D772